MENVLIISSRRSSAEGLGVFMRDTFGCRIRTADTAQQAREIISVNRSWELVMINMPLQDESGLELAKYVAEDTAASCVIFVKAEEAEKIMDTADRSSIIVITKPFSRQTLYQILKAVDTALRRSWSLYEETVRLERKIEEIRLIDKAKFSLMQYRGMTEEEAHTYLEQYAMKNRKKKTIAASELIDKINEQYL